MNECTMTDGETRDGIPNGAQEDVEHGDGRFER